MKQLFLRSRHPGSDCATPKRAGFWCWNLGLYVLALLVVSGISMALSMGPDPASMGVGCWEDPLLVFLNTLPVLALGLLLYGIIGRTQWAFLLTAAIVLGLSAGNYFKLIFRDDPLMFADMLLLQEAGAMAAQYRPVWDHAMILTVLLSAVCFALLWLLARGIPKRWGRVTISLAGLVVCGTMMPVLLNNSLYEGRAAHYDKIGCSWSVTQQYVSHGFLYPFLHSISEAIDLPPEDYDKRAVQEELSQFQDADIPEDQKVNILALMLESYNDFTKYGTPELTYDIYATWHQLEQEGYAGNLVTNIFAGGTVDTERCFLTGYSSLTNFRSNTNSYAWYLRQQGYRVEGMHPYSDWFYNRSNVNEYLGFQAYYMMENYFSALTDEARALDNLFFAELLKTYQAGAASDQPYFNFSVSFQGHGPYNDDICWWGPLGGFVKESPDYTTEQQYILDNYFGSIANTTENIRMLTDYLRTDSEPVVLVLFGDHNPWLGDGNSVYDAIGLTFDLDTQQGFLDYYSTRYIIWANDAAKEVLGSDIQGEGPDISPCFLMQQVFDLCGWEGPAYMQAARAVEAQVPVVHTSGQYLVDGTLTNELEDDKKTLVSDFMNLQYYWRKHFAYGKD